MDDREEGEILEYGFLSFPPEVRLKIYNYLFISDGPVEKVQVDIGKKLQGGKTIAEGSKCAKRRHCACLSSRFLQTCSTVKIEALPILLGFNTFHLDKAGDINNIKEIIPPSSYKLIQHLKTAKNGPCGTDLTQEFFTIKRVNQLLAFRTLKSFHYTFTERQGLVPENIVDVESHVAKHSAAVDFTIPLLLKHFSPLQVTTYYYGPVPCTNEVSQVTRVAALATGRVARPTRSRTNKATCACGTPVSRSNGTR